MVKKIESKLNKHINKSKEVMNLKKYDNKLVKIIDDTGTAFEGLCYFYDKEYNEHEYGRNEKSLKILNVIFFESTIKDVTIIDTFDDSKYGNLELLIIGSDTDFIQDALEYENEIHNDRLVRCINDNIEKLDKEKILEIIKKYYK